MRRTVQDVMTREVVAGGAGAAGLTRGPWD